MRKDFLKSLSNKQLESLECSIHMEKMFREYQRKQKRSAKLPPSDSILATLSMKELRTIFDD